MSSEPSQNPNQTMSFDDYKRKVAELLQKWYPNTTAENERLMRDYADDLPTFWRDGWGLDTAATAMVFNY